MNSINRDHEGDRTGAASGSSALEAATLIENRGISVSNEVSARCDENCFDSALIRQCETDDLARDGAGDCTVGPEARLTTLIGSKPCGVSSCSKTRRGRSGQSAILEEAVKLGCTRDSFHFARVPNLLAETVTVREVV